MKKRISIAATILAVAALAAVPFVYAGPGPGHGRMGGHMGSHMGEHGGGFGFLGGGRHLAFLAGKLDLTEQQTDQIKAIFADLHEQNAQYRDSMHGGFKAVADALLKNPNDLAGAQALLDQQAASERAMKQNMLAATSKALNVLTTEQRTELSKIIAEHGERRERRSR
jgi:Spy/CpxP family protein refolding chaperone